MARETKAQRMEREAKEAELELAELQYSYPFRLMSTLERATKFNFTIEVVSGKFEMFDRDASYPEVYKLGITYSHENEGQLAYLEWAIAEKEHEENAKRVKMELKNSALSKLTKEEKEALGL